MNFYGKVCGDKVLCHSIRLLTQTSFEIMPYRIETVQQNEDTLRSEVRKRNCRRRHERNKKQGRTLNKISVRLYVYMHMVGTLWFLEEVLGLLHNKSVKQESSHRISCLETDRTSGKTTCKRWLRCTHVMISRLFYSISCHSHSIAHYGC